jgi:carboxymethylenebutenolidase
MPVAMTDFDAARSWLRHDARVAQMPVAVMGFCMGGGVALGYGMHDSTVAGVVMFYGFPETDPAKLAALRAPVMAHFGARDDGIPPAKVESFRDGMKQAGRSLEVFTYADAGHAFMNDRRPSYAPAAAKQAWARTLEFLRRTLHPTARE